MELSVWLVHAIPACLLAWACASATWTDLRDRTISNRVCYGALLAGALYYSAVMVLFEQTAIEVRSVFAVTAGQAFGGAFLCAAALYPFWHAGGIGGGDVKFVAVLGMFLGPASGLTVIGLGSVLAVLFCFGKRMLPQDLHWRLAACDVASQADSLTRRTPQPSALPLAGFLSLATVLVVLQPLFNA